jgi:hypothetical protein
LGHGRCFRLSGERYEQKGKSTEWEVIEFQHYFVPQFESDEVVLICRTSGARLGPQSRETQMQYRNPGISRARLTN